MLVLEDGTVFPGCACGAEGTSAGEAVFNTSMCGYQEVLSDPSYAGQIITMTQPHIGNYGTNGADMESRGVFARGLVVREASAIASNWRSEESLPAFLRRHGTVAIEGVDTRMLTRHIREAGAMRAAISTELLEADALVARARECAPMAGSDFVREVAITEPYVWGSEGAEPRYRVVAFDSGIKYNILRRLAETGCEVTLVPPTYSADEVLAMKPDGVFLANGPGDPAAVEYLYSTLRALVGRVPLFGICLGHQMLSLAMGAGTFKLKYGHRGGNLPVKNLLTGRVEITSQNHGFCVDFASIGPLVPELSGGIEYDPADLGSWAHAGAPPVVRSETFGPVQLTHLNLNDMTCEGIRLLEYPAFSVQYHPEAAPGPHDSRYLFGSFARCMDGVSDYLVATG
ncbi:MAG: carbamoyl-phosphate synthase small subunit [Coriobacteriaceae bacterium]|nr:carbamoyl-phosphate synthase small subunit [Coriobacteriaceae bacterium]